MKKFTIAKEKNRFTPPVVKNQKYYKNKLFEIQ